MKKGWPTKTLAEVCQIKPPKSEARDKVSASSLVSFLPMEDMGIDVKFVQATQTKPLSAVVGSYTYFADGDVLLAKITPCFENGKLGIADGLSNGIGFGSSEYFVFRPDPTVSKEWLYYFLSRETFRVEGAARMSGAVGHKRVSKEFIEDYPIPVPPLAEQQRIVGLLDEAFEGLATAKANAEKNLQNAHALFESHLQSVFTQRGPSWVEKSLGETCEMYQPKTIGTKDLVPDGPYPVFGANGVIGRYDKFNHEEPQLLVTCRGATCGSVNISEPKSWITGNAMVVRPKDHALDLHFLEFVFRGGIDISSAITGAAQPQITRTNLSPLLIRYPKSVTEQTRLADKFEDLSEETQRLARLYERKLAALEALKKSLLHQAFTGAL